MAGEIAGVINFSAKGRVFSLEASAKVSPLMLKKEKLVGLTGVAGHKVEPRVPWIEVTIFTTEDFDVQELADMQGLDDDVVQLDARNKWSYGLNGAILAGDVDIDVAEGKADLRFEGDKSFTQAPS